MRLDLYLKKVRLVRQRSLAKALCDAGKVTVNGRPAKPAQVVHPEDRIHLELPSRRIEARVVGVPEGNVARRDVERWVEITREESRDRVDRVLGED